MTKSFETLEFYSLFPYLKQSILYAHNLNISIDKLISSPIFENIRVRGISKIQDSILHKFVKPSLSSDVDSIVELLSYPYIKVILSCLNDKKLIRKYAFEEAKSSIDLIKQPMYFTLEQTIQFCVNLDINVITANSNNTFKIHFLDYIKYTIYFKDLSWKLSNKNVQFGYVLITKDELLRIIQQAIYVKIENSFSIEIDSHVYNLCKNQLEIISSFYQKNNSLKNIKNIESHLNQKEANINDFPLCMSIAIKNVKDGTNLAHTMRFSLVSFLNGIGVKKESILEIFCTSPDFNDSQSKYQINHIISKNYKCPSCSTMKTYGNCIENCPYFNYNNYNPISIYIKISKH